MNTGSQFLSRRGSRHGGCPLYSSTRLGHLHGRVFGLFGRTESGGSTGTGVNPPHRKISKAIPDRRPAARHIPHPTNLGSLTSLRPIDPQGPLTDRQISPQSITADDSGCLGVRMVQPLVKVASRQGLPVLYLRRSPPRGAVIRNP